MRSFFLNAVTMLVIGGIFFFTTYRLFVAPPGNFPVPYDLTVSAGETSSSISQQLVADGVIRSRRTFQLFMVALGGETHISEGEYLFDHPISSLAIALRISGREFGISRTKVTFPEGYTSMQMTTRLGAAFPSFDTAGFAALANASQGYLFPDTYKFFPTPLPDQVIAALKDNYERKVAPLRPEIALTGHTEAEIIIMASIVQKEAAGQADSPVIAGILWQRIQNGMPLQVDAVPSSYTHRGLPNAPINNPGLMAITAAIHPTASAYLYYLHDSSGAIHYASTYQQHEQNIKKYLK